jgi:hypothetical protein
MINVSLLRIFRTHGLSYIGYLIISFIVAWSSDIRPVPSYEKPDDLVRLPSGSSLSFLIQYWMVRMWEKTRRSVDALWKGYVSGDPVSILLLHRRSIWIPLLDFSFC